MGWLILNLKGSKVPGDH